MKKISYFIMAFVTVFSIVASVFSATAVQAATNQTTKVTLHKLLMDKDTMVSFETPKDYDGTQNLDQLKLISGNNSLKEIANVYFAWQNESGQWVDQSGDVVSTVDQAYGMLTSSTGAAFDTSGFKPGKYKIVEVDAKTTYEGPDNTLLAASKAVPVEITLPMVNANGYVSEAHVYPKNTGETPTVQKNITDSNPKQLGEDVPYSIVSTFNAGSRYQTLTWNDSMSEGLTMNPGVNITANNGVVFGADDYQLLQDSRGFSLRLKQTGIDKLNAVTSQAGKDVTVTLTYTAQINANAFTSVNNRVTLNYGNSSSTISDPKPVTPSSAGELTVTKTWANADGTQINPIPAGIDIIYSLMDSSNNPIASAKITSDTPAGESFNLGNGITFVSSGNGSGTFKGLKSTESYTIFERVNGYAPEYTNVTAGAISISNKKNNTPEKMVTSDAQVALYSKRFVKMKKGSSDRLENAQFIVKKGYEYLAYKSSATRGSDLTAMNNAKAALDKAIADYNKMPSTEQQGSTGQSLKASIPNLQKAYEDALKTANVTYTTTSDRNDANIVKLTSNTQGQFELIGLEAGDYQLEEIVAPIGYALLSSPIDFTVGAAATADNVDYVAGSGKIDALRVDNVTLSIPQTGGMGTVIFIVVGITLMTIAGIALAKNNKKDETVG